MNTTIILVLVIVVITGIGYFGWKRSIKLRRKLNSTEAKLAFMAKNLETFHMIEKDDSKAQANLLEIDREIVNAKTQVDAARIRRKFVSAAYSGL